MISKMRYKTFYYDFSDGCPFICLGSIRTTSILLRNNLLKGMAVALGWLFQAMICISSVTAIPVRFVRNL
jgi:hypothetical protein